MITEIDLLENGFEKTEDPLFPFEKNLSEVEEDDEMSPIVLAISQINGKSEMVLILPECGTLHLNINSVDELKAFEGMLAGYSPDW
jgi:hypothetical protein